MKTYIATRAFGGHITEVIAADAADAHRQLTSQLQRPGRVQYYEAWKRDGFLMESREGQPKVA